MKRFLLIFGILTLCSQLQAQPTVERPLNGEELGGKKWYYSIDSAMANPEDVFKLSLANMKLKAVPQEIFLLPNLQILTLSENRIKKLPPEIKTLENLQVISLYKNRIKYLPLELRDLSRLETLYLGNNKLMELPVWVGGLGKLKRLDISRNRFTPLEITHIRNMMSKRVEITI
jgi:Leucine-rich repeat (LRR) protein